MAGWETITVLADDDGARRVEVQQGPDGFYRYVVAVWMAAAPEDEGALGDGFWQTERISGLFDDAETCAADSRHSES